MAAWDEHGHGDEVENHSFMHSFHQDENDGGYVGPHSHTFRESRVLVAVT